jgi:hypothetical protein
VTKPAPVSISATTATGNRLPLPEREKRQGERTQAEKHKSGGDNDIHGGCGVRAGDRQEGRRSPPSGRPSVPPEQIRHASRRGGVGSAKDAEWERTP